LISELGLPTEGLAKAGVLHGHAKPGHPSQAVRCTSAHAEVFLPVS